MTNEWHVCPDDCRNVFGITPATDSRAVSGARRSNLASGIDRISSASAAPKYAGEAEMRMSRACS